MPGDSVPLAEPDDCSAVPQADDRFFVAALRVDCWEPVDSFVDDCSDRVGSAPGDCWAAVPDGRSAPGVRSRGSAADSAQAGYSVPADSSRADYLEQADSAPDDC